MADFESQSMSIIKNSNMLSEIDLSVLDSMRPELQDTFQHAQIFRTRTEMDISVLNDMKFPTADSKYWQSVREQNVMFNELISLSYEYRKNQIEIRILERDLDQEPDALKQELIQIEIERKQFVALGQLRTARDRIREIQEWSDIKAHLLPQMECSLTDVNEHQLLSYTQRFIQQSCQLTSNTGIAEANNLMGQLHSSIRECAKRHCADKLLAKLPDLARVRPDINRMILEAQHQQTLLDGAKKQLTLIK